MKCATGVPRYRGEVRVDGADVATVTASAWSPTLECGIGYVRFDHAEDWVGRTVTVAVNEGSQELGVVVTLPFFDGEKLIPRGLPAPA